MKKRTQHILIGATVVLVGLAIFAREPLLLAWQLRQAKEELKLRRAESAVRLLESAQAIAPENGEVQFLLGRAYRRLGHYAKMVEHLQQSMEYGIDPDAVGREQVIAMAQQGQLEAAEERVDSLLKSSGDDLREVCEAMVAGYFVTSRYEEGMRLIDAWQADYPDDEQSYYFTGRYEEYKQQWPEAEKNFRRSLKLAPDRDDVRLRLAITLLMQGSHEEAVRHSRQCIESDPNNLDARAIYGDCLLKQGRREEAQAVFEQLLTMNSDSVEARVALADMAQFNEEHEKVLELVGPVAERYFANNRARNIMATSLQALGRYEDARKHITFLADYNEYQNELRRVKAMLDRDPNNVKHRYRHAWILINYCDPEAGLTQMLALVAKYPEHVQAHAQLAQYYKRQGNEELAARHQDYVDTFAPTTPQSDEDSETPVDPSE